MLTKVLGHAANKASEISHTFGRPPFRNQETPVSAWYWHDVKTNLEEVLGAIRSGRALGPNDVEVLKKGLPAGISYGEIRGLIKLVGHAAQVAADIVGQLSPDRRSFHFWKGISDALTQTSESVKSLRV
jgi:hypothetical protein